MSRFRSRCDLGHIQPKSEPRAGEPALLQSGAMCMRDGRQWDWYQPIAKADANGDHRGHHLHGPRDRAVIG